MGMVGEPLGAGISFDTVMESLLCHVAGDAGTATSHASAVFRTTVGVDGPTASSASIGLSETKTGAVPVPYYPHWHRRHRQLVVDAKRRQGRWVERRRSTACLRGHGHAGDLIPHGECSIAGGTKLDGGVLAGRREKTLAI
jgi:hypothetical protein